jgi:hypothetical protein
MITGVVTHACNPCTWEAEAGRSRARGQSGLQSKTLSQENEQKCDTDAHTFLFEVVAVIILKLEFLAPGPNSLSSTCEARPPAPVQRQYGEGREGRFDYMTQAAVGRGRVSTQPVFSHLGVRT